MENQPKRCEQLFSASKDKTSLAQPMFHLTTVRKEVSGGNNAPWLF